MQKEQEVFYQVFEHKCKIALWREALHMRNVHQGFSFKTQVTNTYRMPLWRDALQVQVWQVSVLANQETRGLILDPTLVKSLSNSKPVRSVSAKQDI